ncbi:Stp2p [Sugiyamaella lignohabitans]|uniref:Stp2p n=1 Tax=Sugiyamaella lignohabitans TaxID=796027 RepID=A0A167CA54_9ASCO|nr:Stp2p [Sugiyamaella lignohabitans]ANB11419.1 Stp2p [Sugiyamaella lignohabitans]
MSETVASGPKSFWRTLVDTLASLSSGVLESIWKILSPVTKGGQLFMLKPLDLLLPAKDTKAIESGSESSKPTNSTTISSSKSSSSVPSDKTSVSKDVSTATTTATSSNPKSTSLFPSGEIKSLNSTKSKVGFPVACATSDASAFDVIQLRNQNGTVVGWDFSSATFGPHDNNSLNQPTNIESHFDQAQNAFFHNASTSLPNQSILAGLDNLGFMNDSSNIHHQEQHQHNQNQNQMAGPKQPNSKLVMRRNHRASVGNSSIVGSFPYSRQYKNSLGDIQFDVQGMSQNNVPQPQMDMNIPVQNSASVFSPSEFSDFEVQYNQQQPPFSGHRSDSINSAESSVPDFHDHSSNNHISQSLPADNHFYNYSDGADLSPPELEMLRSPVGFYNNTPDFNAGSTPTIRGANDIADNNNNNNNYSSNVSSHHSSDSPDIFPINNNNGLFPVDPINSHNIMVNGVYPLVHSRANSENGSPEHVTNLNLEKPLDDLSWPGLAGLPAAYTGTTSSPTNSIGLTNEDLATPHHMVKQDEFHSHNTNNSHEMLPIITPDPLESWGYLNSAQNGSTNAILSPESSVTSASSIDLLVADESSPLSIVSMASSGAIDGIPVTASPSNSELPNQFACPECDASFRIKGYLTRHMKKHADQKAYTCPFFDCTAETPCHPSGGFSRRDTYKTHLKARHFIYPTGTRSENRSKVIGTCGGCGDKFDSNERWVEDHIQMDACAGLKKA